MAVSALESSNALRRARDRPDTGPLPDLVRLHRSVVRTDRGRAGAVDARDLARGHGPLQVLRLHVVAG